MRRNDCIEGMSARLAGIETYLVTDCMIGDAASSGADNVSDSLGFESWILANYWV
jgi:signal recognition particle GTPase